jgi:hypothetical protein
VVASTIDQSAIRSGVAILCTIYARTCDSADSSTCRTIPTNYRVLRLPTVDEMAPGAYFRIFGLAGLATQGSILRETRDEAEGKDSGLYLATGRRAGRCTKYGTTEYAAM